MSRFNPALALNLGGSHIKAVQNNLTNIRLTVPATETGQGVPAAPGQPLPSNNHRMPSKSLFLGSSGADVALLRQQLQQLGFPLPATELTHKEFGPVTHEAVRKF